MPPRRSEHCQGSSPSGMPAKLEAVLREHLVALCGRVDLLAVADEQSSSTSTRCYARSMVTPSRASYGHTHVAGKQILRKGLSPRAPPISTASCAPVIAGCDCAPGGPTRARARGAWSPEPAGPPATAAPT